MLLRFLAGLWLCLAVTLAQAQVTSFTYQGRLENGGEPVTGLYDFEFHLYSTEQGEPAFTGPISLPQVGVTNGLFSALLDFGPQFNGGAQYLELRVRPSGDPGAYVVLRPRQRVTASPYASRAGSVLGPISVAQLPSSVVLNNQDVRMGGRLDASNPGNRLAGDGSGLKGVLATGLGAGGEVRFQEGFFRRLAETTRTGLNDYWSSGVLAGDFNGDGRPDLMVSLAGIGVANLYTNAGGGLLKQSSLDVGGVFFSPKLGVTGDFNRDGRLDLACVDPFSNLIRVFTNYAGGNLGTLAEIRMTNVTALVALDVNSDGLMDLAAADIDGNQARVNVLLSSGSGMVQSTSLQLPSQAADLAAGDLDGGGSPELVVACTGANLLRVFRNNAGTLELAVDVPAVSPRAVALGCLVRGSPSGLTYVSDPAFTNGQFEDSMIRTLVRSSALVFQPYNESIPVGYSTSRPVRLTIRDFNADGQLDALTVVEEGFSVGYIAFHASTSSSTLPRLVGSWGWSGVTDVDVADFNGDQVPDLGTGTIQGAQVWLRDGSGVTTRSYAQFENGVAVQGTILASGGLDVTGHLDITGEARAESLTVAETLEVPGTSTLSRADVSDSLSFGTQSRQMLNLYGVSYALGVQEHTLYFRTGTGDPASGFAWFRGGSHTNRLLDPGPDGQRLMNLSSRGLNLAANGGTLALGELGSSGQPPRIDFLRGTNLPAGYDVRLINDPPGNLQILGNSTISGTLGFGDRTRQMLNLWSTEYGLGVQSSSAYFRSAGDFMWFRRGAHSDTQGDPGTGGTRLMRLTSEGRLGLGVESPLYPLDVQAASGVARLISTNGGFGSVLVLRNTTPSPQYLGAINFESTTSTAGQIGYEANDQMTFRVAGSQRMVIDGAGNVAITGAFSQASDRHAKENLRPVDPQAVLEKVASLPLSEWNYRQDPGTRHLGPMAQDFHAAFGVGPDDRHITTVDADGVALAAIQGLNQKLNEARRENEELRARLERIERLLESRKGE